MNTTRNTLSELEVRAPHVQEAVRILLHTILFSRSLGPVIPDDVDSSVFPNITYLTCGVPDVANKVEEAISRFCSSLQLVGPDLCRGEITIAFFEKRTNKSFFGMSTNEEKVVWEQWVVPMLVNRAPDSEGCDSHEQIERVRKRETEQQAMTASLLEIVKLINQRTTDHIPPFRINAETAMVFPFEISVSRTKESTPESWLSTIMRSEPPMLS